ncbi:hypothetical protein PQX77_016448 [Marasmius sp. AFHP31]|nr:hypothetical protein PQX77_016448 [Marasmius sp. AFHP31]
MPLLDSVFLDQYFMMGPKDTRGCVITYTLSAWSSLLGIDLSELLLALRIWAVWAQKPTIGIILVVISLACVVPSMIFFGRFVGGVQYPLLNIPTPKNEDLRRCFFIMQNKDIYLCWIALMVYDSVSFVLMGIAGFKAYRTGGTSNLVKAVYRDGIMYYALIFFVSLVNVTIILILPHDYIHIISPFERVLHSILASHAILHIRRAATQNVNQEESVWDFGTGTGELDSTYPSMSLVSNVMQTVDEERPRATGSGNL